MILDLDHQQVREHWRQASPELARLFEDMQATEDWTLDQQPAIAMSLVQVGRALSVPGAAAALERMDQGRLLFLLVYISSAKAVRLLQWLDTVQPGAGTRLVEALLQRDGRLVRAGVPEKALVATLLQRLRMLQNQPFLKSVFDPQAMTKLASVIKQHREETQHA